ncbi:MAG TPA: NUDIX hydrolase [Jatrophihabitans sp.]|jgi:ADP-ribose pyrophosphatase
MSEVDGYPVLASDEVYSGRVIGLRMDSIRMSDGSVAQRDVVEHPGAVAVVAIDEDDPRGVNVVTVSQYRHPLRLRLVELPAGLLDVDGESALLGAQRELAEEALLAADEWHVLLDIFTSPGMSNEAVRVYLARGLRPAPRPADFEVEHEELTMTVERVSLDELVRQALRGELTNAIAVAGVLALAHVVGAGIDGAGLSLLRPADVPWPARPGR